jgi:GAF domain-containing protein
MRTPREPTPRAADKPEAYRQLERELAALLEGEHDLVANAANTAALLFEALPELNWAGFYFARASGELVLGPFQGRPACVRIPAGRGVCGAAAQARRTLVVPDVHAFAGHIACDAASNSEIVVPLLRGNLQDGELLGVLDLDSPRLARFDDQDRAGLERLAAAFVRSLDRG